MTIDEKLDIILKQLEDKLTVVKVTKYESEQTNEINTALAKSQSEYPKIYLNRVENYLHNAYTDLDNIMFKIRPILGKYEISYTQRTKPLDSRDLLLETRIWHSTGQWIETVERVVPSGNDLLSYKSALNELKKTQLTSLLGITISNDEFDDNGNAALAPEYAKMSQPENPEFTHRPEKESYRTISAQKAKELEIELSFVPGLEAKLLKFCHVRSLYDIPESQYEYASKLVKDNKESYLNKKR